GARTPTTSPALLPVPINTPETPPPPADSPRPPDSAPTRRDPEPALLTHGRVAFGRPSFRSARERATRTRAARHFLEASGRGYPLVGRPPDSPALQRRFACRRLRIPSRTHGRCVHELRRTRHRHRKWHDSGTRRGFAEHRVERWAP